jgi:hypothetical protein
VNFQLTHLVAQIGDGVVAQRREPVDHLRDGGGIVDRRYGLMGLSTDS